MGVKDFMMGGICIFVTVIVCVLLSYDLIDKCLTNFSNDNVF